MIKQPLYIKVREDLKSQILKGIYKEEDMLPSENELCDLYDINRSTARQALNDLVSDGYIKKRRGKGSIVVNKHRSLGLLSIRGFSQVVSGQNERAKSTMIQKPRLTKWEADFFYPITPLELMAGCIYFKRLRSINETPVMIEQTYIPNFNLPRFCNSSFVNDSLFDTLSYNYNIEIKNVEQDMRSVLSDTHSARSLKIKKGAPLLLVYLKYITNRDNLNLYSSLLYNTDKYSIGNLI